MASPESQGIPSRALLALLRAYDERLRFPHAFVFRRHGKTVSETAWAPYSLDIPHQLFSLSKSFTSSAIGMAVGEGLLSLDDRILSFFPECDTPAVGPLMRKVTLRHLLTMSCGHADCPAHRLLSADPACDLVRSFLELEPVYEPGTKFAYNSIGTYMLSAALRKVTGQNLSEYLRPRLFDPLGIGPVYWEKCLCHGTDMGGWGLWLSTRDIAKAGQLWLDFGRWEGRPLIPEEYVREATSWQIQNGPSAWPDWVQGYGYQFWQCQQRCVRGDGAYGQFVVMDRRRDTVFAFHSAIGDLQEPLTLLWDTLLFSMSDKPLPEDPAALAELRDFEASRRTPTATFPPPEPSLESAPSEGGGTREYTVQRPVPASRWSVSENPMGLLEIALAPEEGGASVTMRFRDRVAVFNASFSAPVESTTELVDAGHAVPVFADLAWTGPDALRIVAIPSGMVNRFTLDFAFRPDGSAALSLDSWLWFFHDDWRKAELTLKTM